MPTDSITIKICGQKTGCQELHNHTCRQLVNRIYIIHVHYNGISWLKCTAPEYPRSCLTAHLSFSSTSLGINETAGWDIPSLLPFINPLVCILTIFFSHDRIWALSREVWVEFLVFSNMIFLWKSWSCFFWPSTFFFNFSTVSSSLW